MSATAAAAAATGSAAGPLRMYIVVRRDLLTSLNWPLGSVISQGCHAVAAALATFRDDDAVREYTSAENLPMMHKVVFEVKDEQQLLTLSQQLDTAGVRHVRWTEQPENILTALATKPYYKAEVGNVFRKCSLFK